MLSGRQRPSRAMSSALLGGQRPTVAAGLVPRYGLSRLLPARTGRLRNLMQLVREIRDYNADAGKAVSNILRLANHSLTVRVFQMDGDTPDQTGQDMINELISETEPLIALEYGGGIEVLADMIHLSAATQGAAALEIELADNAQELADIVAVNPWVIDFERDEETLRWVPGILNLGQFTPLHPLQFKYIPLDPEPGKPRGRSPFLAALDIIFFQMEVLRDLKAAAHFAGYPRIDISVAWEAVYRQIEQSRPDLLQPGNEDALREYQDDVLGDIVAMVDDLEPDDAFIHYDQVDGKYIVPTGKAISTDELIGAIDTQIVSGLKQLPVLMGRNEGATTTHATVQWQIYAREIEAFRRVSSQLLSWALSFSLRVAGRQAIARIEYEPLRAFDRLQEAQAESAETQTAAEQVRLGWITNDEAALRLVGHEAVGEPEPAPIEEPDEEPDEEPADEESLSEIWISGDIGHSRRDIQEELDQLPFWQRQRYRAAEDAFWETYREQLADAWRRMDERLATADPEDLEEPEEDERAVSAETLRKNGQPAGGSAK